jgi:hypothetical protein
VMVAIVNNVETLLRMKRVDRRLLTTQSYGIRMPFNLRLKMVQLLPVFGRYMYIQCTNEIVRRIFCDCNSQIPNCLETVVLKLYI